MDHTSPNTIQSYLAQPNVELHPDLYSQFITQLTEMAHKDQVCLLPITLLENFHTRLRKAG